MTLHLEPPPGEDGIELHGEAASSALLAAVDAQVQGDWYVVTFRFHMVGKFTIKLAPFWANALYTSLGKALGR